MDAGNIDGDQAVVAIQVCYAKPDRQILLEIRVPVGITIHQAILQSGILQEAPEIDLSCCHVGVYNKVKVLDALVREHDRIEIYRPLIADPKDSRRKRAEKKALIR